MNGAGRHLHDFRPRLLAAHPALAASEPMTAADINAFDDAGLPRGWLELVRRARVLDDGPGRFQVHPNGKPRWLLPVLADLRDQWSPQPLCSTLAGDLVLDVIAFGRSPRGDVLLHDGLVDFVGNIPGDVAMPVTESPPPLRVHANLHAWLQHAPRTSGIVLVGDCRDEHRRLLRSATGGVVADSVAHGERLLALMRDAPPTLPPIMVEQLQVAA